MSKTKLVQIPLLYIHHPNTEAPVLNTQKTYLIKNTTENQQIQNNNVNEEVPLESENLMENNSGNTSEKIKDEIEPTDINMNEGPKSNSLSPTEESVLSSSTEKENILPKKKSREYSFQKVKPFKEMSIDEKLQYIINFPKQISPIPYLFITGSTAYIGIYYSHTKEQIQIRQQNGNITTINKADITGIKMQVHQ